METLVPPQEAGWILLVGSLRAKGVVSAKSGDQGAIREAPEELAREAAVDRVPAVSLLLER